MNGDELFNPLMERLSRLLMWLDLLDILKTERAYEDCAEGGDPLLCWMKVGEPMYIPRPPRPPRPDVLEAASYAEILKGMHADALETVEIIEGLMKKEPPF